MSTRPAHHLRIQGLWDGIMQTIHHHRTRFFSEPNAEGFRIYLSLGDANVMAEIAERSRNPGQDLFAVPAPIRDGDTGTLFGLPFTADAHLHDGTSFIGYRVHARQLKGS